MILGGLDLATRTGVCIGRPADIPRTYAIQCPPTGNDLGQFGAFYMKAFSDLLMRLENWAEPGERILVCYEAPILPRETTVSVTRKLHSLGVILEALATERRIEVRECSLTSIKKELTGTGRADKDQMVLAARRAGLTLPSDPKEAKDAADAFGAWLLAIRHHATKAEAAAWDRRVWGSRDRERGYRDNLF